MMMNAKRLVMAAICGVMTWSAVVCLAAGAEESARQVLDKLLKAVQANDYDSFVADGTAEVKAALTKQMLEGVSAQIAPRLERGYDATYLGELRQSGCKVYLWKLAYKDGGDDTLAKLSIKDGKVAGFLLQ